MAIASVLSGPTIFFAPGYPHGNYIIRKLCAFGGIEATTDPDISHDLGFFFTDQTFASHDQYHQIDGSFANYNCTNISKSHVQEVFERVFGYSLSIDPTIYKGEAVAKSNANAKHDGTVVSCPVQNPPKNKVYQKRVDNRVEDDIFIDYRTTIVGNAIPVVVCKYWRPEGEEMPGAVIEANAANAEDLFTNDEIKNILEFSRRLGLDYGELDILRDNGDGNLYIVDANSTPIGPRVELSDEDYHEVLERMLDSLCRNLISK